LQGSRLQTGKHAQKLTRWAFQLPTATPHQNQKKFKKTTSRHSHDNMIKMRNAVHLQSDVTASGNSPLDKAVAVPTAAPRHRPFGKLPVGGLYVPKWLSRVGRRGPDVSVLLADRQQPKTN
jgi:hypothetical protein